MVYNWQKLKYFISYIQRKQFKYFHNFQIYKISKKQLMEQVAKFSKTQFQKIKLVFSSRSNYK